MKLDIFNIIAGLAVLIVILLIIQRLYLIYNAFTIENFTYGKCDFEATGSSPLDCMNKCLDDIKCSYLDCDKICTACEQEERKCPWDPQDFFEEETNNTNKLQQVPPAPKIDVTTTFGKAKVKFRRPKDFLVDGYIYYIFKTFNRDEGITMGLMPNSSCTVCEKVFERLDTETAYSIGVKGYNVNGIGKMSNITMFKPVDKFVARDYSLEPSIDKFSENLEMCQ